jgi:choline dehydrogenase-like flavoprotein
MFIDLTDYSGPAEIESDLCIVGAGAAGITLALELAGSGGDVCVLESGGLEYDHATQQLADGETAGLPYYELVAARLRYFGGTTNHWAGISRPLDELDFQKRDAVPYSGWPIDRASLDPYYARAQQYCRLGTYNYEPGFRAAPDAPLLPVDGRLETKIMLENPVRFGPAYREQLNAAPTARVVLFANATELEPDASGLGIARIHARSLNENRLSVAARNFVTAAGAIENARLLLASRSVHSDGIGNDHGLVGRFFMEHPLVPTMELQLASEEAGLGLYTGQSRNGLGVTGYLALTPETVRREGILNACASLNIGGLEQRIAKSTDGIASAVAIWNYLKEGEVPPNFGTHVGNLLADMHRVAIYSYERAFQRSPLAASLVMQMEQAPNPSSRVTLTDERDSLGMQRVKLDWQMGDLERHTVFRFGELMGMEFGRTGLGRIRMIEPNDTGWWDGMRGSWHHMGTTRMHASPTQGVVDANCRVHGMRNLYVAGGSVFPTSGFAHPTLTIVALAIRLAEHLKELDS